MIDCKSCVTPVGIQAKVAADSGPLVKDPTQFWSLADALQYLTFTRPDISYAVQQVCLHMHDPREPHLVAVKRILRYLQGTPEFGLVLRWSSIFDLVVYTDAGWAGCPDTCRSTSATRSSLVTTSSLGPRSARTSSLVQAQRSSIASLPTVFLRRAGYANCFKSSTALAHGVRWSSPPTPSSINTRSTLRSIFTSCMSASPSVMFEFFMFRRRHSSPISSPRVFLHRRSRSFGPVSTSAVGRVSTAGVLELYLAACIQDPCWACWACVPSCIWGLCAPCWVRVWGGSLVRHPPSGGSCAPPLGGPPPPIYVQSNTTIQSSILAAILLLQHF
jgi:hypothetical protein